MEKQQEERKIYLKDLLFSVLYKWRAVLIALLIGAVLFGGMEWLGDSDGVVLNSVSVTPENQIKIDQYKSNLERTEKLIESQTAYLEESILVSLDSYAAFTAGFYASVYPISEETDPDLIENRRYAVLYAYRTCLMSAETMESVAKKHNIPPLSLNELVSLEVNSTGLLKITARGRTLEEAEAITVSFIDVALSEKESISQAIVPHELQYSIFKTGPVIDKALYDQQNTAYQKLTTLKNTAASTQTELNKLLPTQIQPGKPQPLLHAAVGAFLGVFLVAAIACVMHIGSGKVYSARTLKDRTGMRILGRIYGRERKFIDYWLRKLEGRAVQNKLNGIVADIVNRCAEHNRLFVFGANDNDLIRSLTNELANSGLKCTLCTEAAGSAQVMKALPDCDAVVLVETCGVSAYDDVIWTIETVNEYGKTLLGCVLIDG